MKEELLKGLTNEQIAKVKACKNQEEMLAVAKEENIELSQEQLEAVNGGCGTGTSTYIRQGKCVCPYCHGTNVYLSFRGGEHVGYTCYTCNKKFEKTLGGW